jgi:hypothetical protein
MKDACVVLLEKETALTGTQNQTPGRSPGELCSIDGNIHLQTASWLESDFLCFP